MKLRRIYKRDKDGQFARVNSLLGAAADAATKKRLSSKGHRSNRLPRKGDRPRIKPQVLDAAAGKLSLAEGPAKAIAQKHDLSGHNRSEANKAAYRECAKYARELKEKYGADAPTADRIYSAAKLIQRGGDLGAKIKQEEGGDGTPTPPTPPKPPKPPTPPKPLPPKGTGKLRKVTDADIKDALDALTEQMKDKSPENTKNRTEARRKYEALKRAKIRQDNNGMYIVNQKSGIHGQGRTITIDGVNYNARVDRYNKTGPEKVIVSLGSDTVARVPNWDKAATAAALKHYQDEIHGKDPFDLPKQIGYGRKAYIEQQTKDDEILKEMGLSVGSDGPVDTPKPKPPKPVDPKAGTPIAGVDVKRGDVITMNGGKMQYAVVSNDGKTIVAEKLGQYKVTHVRLDVGSKFMKIGEGKSLRRTGIAYDAPSKPKLVNKIDIKEASKPPPVRVKREGKIESMFKSWVWGQKDLDSEKIYNQHNDDLAQVLRKDPEFRKSIFDRFEKDLARGKYKGDWSSSYETRFDDAGYFDLKPEQRRQMAEQDRQILDQMYDEDANYERVKNSFENWMRNSESAYDLAKNEGYQADSLWEIFLDVGGADYRPDGSNYYDNLIDWQKPLERFQKEFYADKTHMGKLLAAAKKKRPVKSDVTEVVPYTAEDRSSPFQLRKEHKSLTDQWLKYIDENFSPSSDFSSLPPSEQEKKRAYASDLMARSDAVQAELKTVKPKRDRNLSDAKNFDEICEIMLDRNPNIKDLKGWNEPDGDLEKAMDKYGIYGPAARAAVLKRVERAFAAAERMSDEYPEVPFDSLNALDESGYSNGRAIAHCSRNYDIKIEMNTKYLTDRPPYNENNLKDDFHPPNFAEDAFYNVLIHEFGHSIDWFAFDLYDILNSGWVAKNTPNGGSVQQVWDTKSGEIFADRDRELRNIIAGLYLDEVAAKRYMRYGGMNEAQEIAIFKKKFTSKYARENYHELIAESWQDYHTNGDKATIISKAIAKFVIDTYNKRVKNGATYKR